MAGTPQPAPADVERALKRLTPDQFSRVCSDIGLLEVTLPGATQAAKSSALVAMTQGHSDFAALVRAINRLEPKAWRAAPARSALPALALSIGAFVVIVGLGVLALVIVLSGSEQAAQASPTPTQTLAPTRTPVPTFTHTPSPSPLPSATLTPLPSATPTRAVATVSAGGPAATHTPTPPPVAIIYRALELQQPRSGYRAYLSETVEFRWLFRSGTLAPDEQYWMRMYAPDGLLVDSYVTPDSWRYYGVPSGSSGSFGWTVTVVKVDGAGNVVGPLSPESDRWTIGVQ